MEPTTPLFCKPAVDTTTMMILFPSLLCYVFVIHTMCCCLLCTAGKVCRATTWRTVSCRIQADLRRRKSKDQWPRFCHHSPWHISKASKHDWSRNRSSWYASRQVVWCQATWSRGGSGLMIFLTIDERIGRNLFWFFDQTMWTSCAVRFRYDRPKLMDKIYGMGVIHDQPCLQISPSTNSLFLIIKRGISPQIPYSWLCPLKNSLFLIFFLEKREGKCITIS